MNTRSNALAFDKWILILIASASIIVVGVWPLFVGVIAKELDLDLAQQSWVISAEALGMVAGTALTAWAGRRFTARQVLLPAFCVVLVGNTLTSLSSDLDTVLALRCITGVAEALIYAMAVFYLGRMPSPDRAFGVLLAIQTLMFSGYAIAFPLIAESFGSSAAINSVGAWFVFLLLISLGLSRQAGRFEASAIPSTAVKARLGASGYIGLAGMACLQLAIYSLWGFIGNIGSAQGITDADIGLAFGIGLLGGLPGAGLASVLGTRLGRTPMIFTGAAMVLIAVLLLARGPATATELSAWIFLLNLGWILALTYYMGMIAAHDRTGLATSLIGLVQIASSTLAPTAVALLVSDNDLQPIFILSCAAAVLAAVLPLLGNRRQYVAQSI